MESLRTNFTKKRFSEFGCFNHSIENVIVQSHNHAQLTIWLEINMKNVVRTP